ncbi:MAG TPA: aminoglycoside phosphotransferase [Trebonia sp.]|jgi:maltokinase|nr:aminoglycoside phosphotransferase [Trebonia sp.]
MAFEQALATWLVEQRWFAGKGHGLRDLAIVAETEIVSGDPELRHMIITVSNGMTVDYYQVLVGFRRKLPDRLSHALIGAAGDGTIAYDALHDADLTKPLLEGFARQSSIGGIHLFTVPGARFSTGLDSLVLTTEQTNTSLVFGDESILKVFRRLFPGPNPDLEVNTALAVLGSAHVAEPLGWAEARLEGVPTALAILSRYLRLASDGWSLAATSVRDLYALADSGFTAGVDANDAGGDFAGEARRLGAATAQVHADLATAFGTDELPTRAIGDLTEQMFRKLDLTVSAVPELAKYADMIGGAYSQLAKVTGPFPVQRVHGDYHLGQVLRTENGWVVLDFEGEPATPLAHRRARSSPLRDVAGMLRSFDYAARHQLIGHPDAEALSGKARDWARRNGAAFCAGYAEAGGLDPAANDVLLRALQLDKAVYEVLYEARHRPSWLPIPLESLADL